MLALSLWQPWASLIAVGAKKIETRGWPTKYRGPLLIHAGKRKHKGDMLYLACDDNYCAALGVDKSQALEHLNNLPYGAFVAIADVVDCRQVEKFTEEELDRKLYLNADHRLWWTERWLGNYEPGRFGWVLENVRPLTAIPYKGEQGLFHVPDTLIMPPGAGQ